jgi:hypothetical protein
MSQSAARIKYEISRIEKIVNDAKSALELYEPILKVYKDQMQVFEAKEKELAAANPKKTKTAVKV